MVLFVTGEFEGGLPIAVWGEDGEIAVSEFGRLAVDPDSVAELIRIGRVGSTELSRFESSPLSGASGTEYFLPVGRYRVVYRSRSEEGELETVVDVDGEGVARIE